MEVFFSSRDGSCQTYESINYSDNMLVKSVRVEQTKKKQRNGKVADHDGFGSLMVSIVIDKLPLLITAMSRCEHVAWHNEL